VGQRLAVDRDKDHDTRNASNKTPIKAAIS
jgi:hypothetical protein